MVSKKRTTKKRVVRRVVKRTAKRKPKVISVYKYQTGTRKSVKVDRKRKALPPGKRMSKTGRKYTETRRNRSDKKGTLL